MVVQFDIKHAIKAKIIVLTQMRDAVRQVSVSQIFKSIQHRDELFNAIILALDELEDQLEEIEMKEEEALRDKEDMEIEVEEVDPSDKKEVKNG